MKFNGGPSNRQGRRNDGLGSVDRLGEGFAVEGQFVRYVRYGIHGSCTRKTSRRQLAEGERYDDSENSNEMIYILIAKGPPQTTLLT